MNPSPDGEPGDGGGRVFLRVLLAAFVGFAFLSAFFRISDVDIGYHVRTGEWVWRELAIPARNLFSSSMPEAPWLLHQGLPAVLIYWVDRWGGVEGLVLAKCVLVVLLACVGLWTARAAAQGGWGSALLACSLMLLAARVRFFERPYLLGVVYLAVLHGLLVGRGGLRLRFGFVLPLLMILWANTHASLLDGVILTVCFWVGTWLDNRWGSPVETQSRVPRMVLPLALGGSLLLAVGSVQVVNPSGAQVLVLPIVYFLDPFWKNLIWEFHPPTPSSDPFFFGYALILVLAQGLTWKDRQWRWLLPSLVFGVLALRCQRAILMFAVVSAPHLALALHGLARRLPPVAGWVPRVALLVLWVALVPAVFMRDPSLKFGFGLHPPYYPMGLFQFMREAVPPQPLFNDMRFGGPMLWFLYPRFRPFIDGRCEAYPKAFWRDVYVPTSEGRPEWRPVFDQYGIRAALVSNPSRWPGCGLGEVLRRDPEWALVAFTDDALLFLKRDDPNVPVIRESEYHCLWPDPSTLAGVSPTNAAAAMAEAERALRLDPDGAFATAVMARSLMVREDYGRAAEYSRRLLEDQRVSGRFWKDHLYCLFMAGRIGESEAQARLMIRKGREPAFAHYILHFVAMRQGRRNEAVEHLHRAVALAPDERLYADALRSVSGGPAR